MNKLYKRKPNTTSKGKTHDLHLKSFTVHVKLCEKEDLIRLYFCIQKKSYASFYSITKFCLLRNSIGNNYYKIWAWEVIGNFQYKCKQILALFIRRSNEQIRFIFSFNFSVNRIFFRTWLKQFHSKLQMN